MRSTIRVLLLLLFLIIVVTVFASCQSSSYYSATQVPLFDEGDEAIAHCKPLDNYAVCDTVIIIVEVELDKNKCYPELTYYDESYNSYCANELQLIKKKKTKDGNNGHKN